MFRDAQRHVLRQSPESPAEFSLTKRPIGPRRKICSLPQSRRKEDRNGDPSVRLHHYNWSMAGRDCYHCKQWIEEGEEHDCWTTTQTALTQDLSENLRDAWERLHGTAVSFAISGFTLRTSRSCFPASPATSLCARRRAFSNSACFSVARWRLLKCDALAARRGPRSFTSFTSDTEMRWKHPSLTGFKKLTNCPTS